MLSRALDGEHQDRDHHHHQQKTGAAAGMESGLNPNILDSQRQARFITVDGLMLCTVVSKDTLHLPHSGYGDHIDHENDDTDQTFYKIDTQVAVNPAVKEAADHHRKQEKQANGHGHAQTD